MINIATSIMTLVMSYLFIILSLSKIFNTIHTNECTCTIIFRIVMLGFRNDGNFTGNYLVIVMTACTLSPMSFVLDP